MGWSVPSPRRKRNVPMVPTWRIHHRHHPPHYRHNSSSTQTQVRQSRKCLTFPGSRYTHGSRRHPFTRQRLFSRGKSLCPRCWLFMPSWKPSKHLQRRFDRGSVEHKSRGRQLRKKEPKVVCKEGSRSKYCASSVSIAF